MRKIIPFLMLLGLINMDCNQESLMFYPEKLPANYQFNFNNEFEELYFNVEKQTRIHGLLFRTKESKGLIFYLHGNGGAVNSWGEIAGVYLQNQYDFFILDYRGYGKSEGKISSEKQFLSDIQFVYDSLKKKYEEQKITIIGYSIGTGPAAYLASANHPRQLILKAPYYNLPDLAKQYLSVVPAFAVRYKFDTNNYLTGVKCPVYIFHGDQDEIINTGSSYKLKKSFKPADSLYILHGQAHNGINYNPVYQQKLKEILNKY
jgi:uncharacterized protein